MWKTRVIWKSQGVAWKSHKWNDQQHNHPIHQLDQVDHNCHAPFPYPTRMDDPNRVWARDYILGLIDLFFLRAELVPVVIQTISVITKIILIYKKNYHQSGVHQNLYTYTESHLLIHVHFFSNIKHQRSRKQCGEHLSPSWPALLMWDVLSFILVFCFCTYTD